MRHLMKVIEFISVTTLQVTPPTLQELSLNRCMIMWTLLALLPFLLARVMGLK